MNGTYKQSRRTSLCKKTQCDEKWMRKASWEIIKISSKVKTHLGQILARNVRLYESELKNLSLVKATKQQQTIVAIHCDQIKPHKSMWLKVKKIKSNQCYVTGEVLKIFSWAYNMSSHLSKNPLLFLILGCLSWPWARNCLPCGLFFSSCLDGA